MSGIPIRVEMIDKCGNISAKTCTWYDIDPPSGGGRDGLDPSSADTIFVMVDGSFRAIYPGPFTAPPAAPTGPQGVTVIFEVPRSLDGTDITMEVPFCPLGGDVMRDGEDCRKPLPLIPGELSCGPGFGLVNGTCIRQLEGVLAAPACPAGSFEDGDGNCRQPVAGANSRLKSLDTITVDKVNRIVFDLPYFFTFYNDLFGLHDGTGRDNREPLGTTWGIRYTIDAVPAAIAKPDYKALEKDTFIQTLSYLIQPESCNEDLAMSFDGERSNQPNCMMSFAEGHDLSISLVGDGLSDVQEATLFFRDQAFFKNSGPFEWSDLEKNMSPGVYPVSVSILTNCGETISLSCEITIQSSECASDFWFEYEDQMLSDNQCTMTFNEGHNLTVYVGAGNPSKISEVNLFFQDKAYFTTTYPYMFEGVAKNMPPGTYPIGITVIDIYGNISEQNCSIVITDCTMTFQKGERLFVSAGGDQSNISKAVLEFKDQTYTDTVRPFEWSLSTDTFTLNTYPLQLTIMDDCDSTIVKNCSIIIEEKTCNSDFWFEYEGQEVPSSNCKMVYPTGQNLSVRVGVEDIDDIQQVTFIYKNMSLVDISYPFEWLDIEQNVAVGQNEITAILQDKCGGTFIKQCMISIEDQECVSDYWIEFYPNFVVGISTPDPIEEIYKTSVKSLTSRSIAINESGNLENAEDPRSLQLFQNTPNPFGESTSFKFYNPINSDTSIKVYDMSGIQIFGQTSYFAKGWHNFELPEKLLEKSGIYFYEVNNGVDVVRKKMMRVE